MSRRRKDRLYLKRGRYYADLRSHADVGGGLEAMRPAGGTYATEDRDTASGILTKRLAELDEARTGRRQGGKSDPRLADYARRHLQLKAVVRRPSTVARSERALRRVLEYFGENVRLSELTVAGLSDYVAHRRRQPGVRPGTTLAAQTILHELHALSSLYRRATSEGEAQDNPVRKLSEKPEVPHREAVYLELDEAARLLGAAAEADAQAHGRAIPFLHPMLSAYLYTGARASELLGMEVGDLDFEEGRVHFRHNRWRRLKKENHVRHVPLWPDLRRTLERYMERHEPVQLLFPNPHGEMYSDLRGSLGRCLKAADIDKHVTLHTLRHTYAATRLQTLDHGHPISPFTVMREMGHRSLTLIEKTYGHLMDTRHRSPVVAYRETAVVELHGAVSA